MGSPCLALSQRGWECGGFPLPRSSSGSSVLTPYPKGTTSLPHRNQLLRHPGDEITEGGLSGRGASTAGRLELWGLQVGDLTQERLPAGRHLLPGVRGIEGAGIETL